MDTGVDQLQKGRGHEIALDVWKRRKWLAIPIFLLVCTTAISVIAFLPDVYKASATVLVERQKVPEEFVQSTVTSDIDYRLQSITQQILSRSRLEALINRFHLYPKMRQGQPLDKVIARARKDIELELQSEKNKRATTTVAFTISYSGAEPNVLAEVANTLASYYIEENLKAREEQASGTSKFLQAQLEDIKRQLATQEQQISQFREQHIGELPEQLQANMSALEQLNTQLRLNSDKQAWAIEQQRSLTQQLTGGDEASDGKAAVAVLPDDTKTRLEQMQRDLIALQTRYGARYPDVIQLKAEIAALEQHLAMTEKDKAAGEGTNKTVSPYVLSLQKEISQLEAQVRALHTEERNLLRSITQYQQRVENTPRREQELHGLKRDYDSTRELYQTMLKRHEEAQLAESLEQRQKGEQFRLLEPAVPPTEPTSPKRRKLALMGLVASLGLAIGAMILAEQLDSTFHTVDDLRAFSALPVLWSLPRLMTDEETRQRRWRFRLAAVSTAMAMVLIVGSSYVVIKSKGDPAELAAQWHRVRTWVGERIL